VAPPVLPKQGRPSVWLDDLYVHPGSRGQGVGGLLMRRLAELAAAADCTHIAWVASASNQVGMAFYRRLGASLVHQAGDTVTLQIEPARLLEMIAPARSLRSGQSPSQAVSSSPTQCQGSMAPVEERPGAVCLRPTLPEDLDFVLEAESHSDNAPL
jgi:hypothetical protein